MGYIVDSTGAIREADDSLIASGVAGGRAATPAEVQAFLEREARSEELGSVSGQAKALGAGVARGLTLGLSDKIATGFVDMQTGRPIVEPSTLEGLREENPGLSLAGEAIGTIAPTLLTGGEALAAKGVANANTLAGATKAATGAARLAEAARFAPPAVVSRIAKAGEAAVADLLPQATTTLGKAARRGAELATGNAIEGAFYGAGQAVSESALGDHELTAENIAADVGLGVLLGGGLGALSGVAEVAIPEAVSLAKGRLGGLASDAADAAGEGYVAAAVKAGADEDAVRYMVANRGAVEELRKAAPDVADALQFADADTAKLVLSDFRIALDPKRNPEAFGRVQKALGESVEATVSGVEDAYRASRKAINAERDSLVAKYSQTAPEAASAEARRLVEEADSMVAKLLEKPDLYDRGTARLLGEIRDGLAERAGVAEQKAQSAGSAFYLGAKQAKSVAPEAVAREVTESRRLIDDLIEGIKGRRHLMDLDTADRRTVVELMGLRKRFSSSLTDAATWGEAAARTHALNEAQSEYIGVLKALEGKANPDFKAKTSKLIEREHGEIQYDPAKIKTWLRQAIEAGGERKTEALAAYVEASRKLVDQLEKTHANVGSAFDAQGLRSLLGKTSTQMEEAQRAARVTAVMQKLAPNVPRVPQDAGLLEGLGTLGAAPLIGSMVAGAGIPAAALGLGKTALALYESGKNVSKTVATLAKLERINQAAAAHIAHAATMAVKGGERAYRAGRGEVTAGIASSFGRDKYEAQRQYDRRVSLVSRLAGDPSLLEGVLAKHAILASHAPMTSQALQVSTSRAVAFLASKVPQRPKAGPLAADWKPSPAEVATFNRYFEAVEKPATLLKQAAAGTLTPEAVEAVKAVHPQTFAQIQQAVLASVAKTKTIPYRQRLMLSLLVGASLDGTTTPAAMAANQATLAAAPAKEAAQQAQGLQGASALSLAGRTQTPSQASQTRGQQ